MQNAPIPITTTCTRPEVDAHIDRVLTGLMRGGMPIRQATEVAARTVAAAAVAQRWGGDLVDFVVIRTVDLGARYAARQAAQAA